MHKSVLRCDCRNYLASCPYISTPRGLSYRYVPGTRKHDLVPWTTQLLRLQRIKIYVNAFIHSPIWEAVKPTNKAYSTPLAQRRKRPSLYDRRARFAALPPFWPGSCHTGQLTYGPSLHAQNATKLVPLPELVGRQSPQSVVRFVPRIEAGWTPATLVA